MTIQLFLLANCKYMWDEPPNKQAVTDCQRQTYTKGKFKLSLQWQMLTWLFKDFLFYFHLIIFVCHPTWSMTFNGYESLKWIMNSFPGSCLHIRVGRKFHLNLFALTNQVCCYISSYTVYYMLYMTHVRAAIVRRIVFALLSV